jgi:5-amino-6-(5-phosphoribosylamino)uracil reductase
MSDVELKANAFAERKSAEASAARLAGWRTDVDCHDPDQIAIGNAWSRARFDGDFYLSPAQASDLPASSAVFVQSRDGNTGAADPSTLGGGEVDKHVIYEGLSRVGADAVLAGANTLRSGNIVLSVWHPELIALRRSLGLGRHPVQVIASLRGFPLDRGLLFNSPELRVVVIAVPDAVREMQSALRQRPWIETVLMAHAADLPEAFRALRAMGIARISVIGGRTIAGALVDAGLIQDLYLTTSPRPGGVPDTPLAPRLLEGKVIVRKHGTGGDEGVRFEHLRLSKTKSET